ncbi:AAA family ATPase [Candidatus Gracilibacteria bacterium]|nr:AAA family ATPase [Candidatus Gracilibacteria bacterium]NUJ98559.1 AAA family ATPase [Candidatus Gracilibacteria bacterium]
MKKVIGIIGKLCAGKDSVGEYISKKYALPLYSISGKVKSLGEKDHISREGLINFSRSLSEKFGDGYIAEKIIEDAKENTIIIVGMRQKGQIKYLKENTQFLLIAIEASDEIRFLRMQKRNRPGEPESLEEFIRIEKEEDGKSVQKISACIKQADICLKNEGEIEDLYKKIDTIVKEFIFSKEF